MQKAVLFLQIATTFKNIFYPHTHACMHAHMQAHAHTHACMHVCMHTHTHAHAHTHTQRQRKKPLPWSFKDRLSVAGEVDLREGFAQHATLQLDVGTLHQSHILQLLNEGGRDVGWGWGRCQCCGGRCLRQRGCVLRLGGPLWGKLLQGYGSR